MSIKKVLLTFLFFSTLIVFSQPKIKLDTFIRPVPTPVDIANDGFTSRLFIADQTGRIFVFDSNGTKLDTFLDIRSKVQYTQFGEQGLLGLAFHPNYTTNGYFYVYYTKKNTTDNAVYRYKVSANPNRAIRDSELLVINLPHPIFSNHNGGCIKFGNDGLLYISVGDGGSGGDPNGNGQNKNTILGKILRIDVNDFSTAYTIPTSNPFFTQTNVRKEIWAYGLRNAWRFTFDRQTHDMWIGDVGQNAREELNFQEGSSSGGENYGWRCYEGNNTYNTSGCGNASLYKFPVFDYDHGANGGVAITGGFVYRGNKYNDLKGYYICADYSSANYWLIKKNGSSFVSTPIGKPIAGIYSSSFGEDIYGELYVSNSVSGLVYKIRELCSPFSINFSQTKNPTCYNAINGFLQITSSGSSGNVSYNWSNGNSGNSISNLAAGKYVVTATDAIGCVRKDSFTLVRPDTLKINLLNKINPSCPDANNGSLEVSGIGGNTVYSYNWSNGSTTALNNNLGAGKYVITLRDSGTAFVCSVKDSFTLTNLDTLDKPLISISNDTLYTAAGFTYKWKRNDTIISNANQSFYKASTAGFYSVEIMDANGCKATSDTVRFVITSLKNSHQEVTLFNIYPNPAKENLQINIQYTSNNKTILRITNTIGQLVYEEHYSGPAISDLISLKRIPAGIYHLNIKLSDNSEINKLFVKE